MATVLDRIDPAVAAAIENEHRRQRAGIGVPAIKKEALTGLFFRRLCDPPPSAKRIKGIVVAPTRLVNPSGCAVSRWRRVIAFPALG